MCQKQITCAPARDQTRHQFNQTQFTQYYTGNHQVVPNLHIDYALACTTVSNMCQKKFICTNTSNMCEK